MNHLGSKTLKTKRLLLKKDDVEDKELLWNYLFSDKETCKKCNMKFEGIKRKSYYKNGKFYDNYLFSKIKEDYL